MKHYSLIFRRDDPFAFVNLIVGFFSDLEAKWFANEWVLQHEGFVIDTVSPFYEDYHDDPALLN